MRRHLVAGAMCLALCPTLPGATPPVQQQLRTEVQRYELAAPTFLDALLKVTSDFRVSMGVELVESPSVLRPVKRTWQKATALVIFTALVNGEEGYHLRVEDGILHVFLEDLVNQRSNFLNIRIKRFDVQGTTASAAGLKLWGLVNPKFQRPKPPTPGPHGTISTGIGGGMPERTFNLSLKDATVRHILNSIVLSSGHEAWVVTFAPGRSLTPTGLRRITSWANHSVPPDVYQPGWELLRWGEKPY